MEHQNYEKSQQTISLIDTTPLHTPVDPVVVPLATNQSRPKAAGRVHARASDVDSVQNEILEVKRGDKIRSKEMKWVGEKNSQKRLEKKNKSRRVFLFYLCHGWEVGNIEAHVLNEFA